MSEQAWMKEPWDKGGDTFLYRNRNYRDPACIAMFHTEADRDRAFACVNAMLNIPDPKAFMLAVDKLVAVCEALRIERGMLALAMDGDDEEMHVELNEVEAALAAAKATSHRQEWILIHKDEGVYAAMSDGIVYISQPKGGIISKPTETGIDQKTGRGTYKIDGVECLPEHMRILMPTKP